MRTIAVIVVLLIASTAAAQDANTTLPAEFFTAHDIEQSAITSVNDLAEQVKSLEADLLEVQKDLVQMAQALESVKSCDCTCNCGKQAAAPAQSVNKITMVTMDGCKACPIAEAYHAPRYKAANWAWSERSDGKGLPSMWYPYYEVCTGDGCTVIQCRNIYELDARISELLARRSSQPVHDKRGRFLGNW